MGASISRRDFLKGAAASAVGFAAIGLTGCANSNGKSQNPGGPDSADSVTKTAVNAAEWYGKEPQIPDNKIVETVDTEILICGAGHSGMIAAVSAATEGAKVVVIEKNATVGTTRSYIGAIGSRAQKEAGVKIDKNACINDLNRYASGRCNMQLLNVWANESGGTLDWLENITKEYGIEMHAEPDVGNGYHGIYQCWPTHHRPILSDTLSKKVKFSDTGAVNTVSYWLNKLDQSELNKALVDKAQKCGAEFRFETPLVKLIKENNHVTGAIAKNSNGYVKINASKGVVLCTGGYAADPDLYSALNPYDADGTTFALVQAGCTGDGIKAGIWAGGHKDDIATSMLFDRGGVTPDQATGYPYAGYPVWYGSQPFLKLDLDGMRFCNESSPYDVSLHAISIRKNKLECMIWDANAWKCIEAFHTISCSRLVLSTTEPPTAEGVGEDVFNGWVQEGIEKGLVFKCDTIDELAGKLKIPTDAAVASVKKYNESCKAGVDKEFGKPAKDLFAIETPPYYGVRLGSWTLCTLDGLLINENMQVINQDSGDPIEGLYACGNNSGGFFCNNYPELFPGVACGRGMTFARHATLHALGKI